MRLFIYMIYATRAFLLKADPLGEEGRVCTFFTEDRGLVTASVRGVRRMTAKQQDALAWFTPLAVRIGHQTYEGGRLLTAEAEERFELSVEQRLIGMAMVDVIRAFGREPERRHELFSLLETAYTDLRLHKSTALTDLIAGVLSVCGYATQEEEHAALHAHAAAIAERRLFCPLTVCNSANVA